MIEDFLEEAGYKQFKIRLPKEQRYTGPVPSLRRGFVFIRFHDRNEAIRLVDSMNGKRYLGGTLRIAMKEDGENAYDSDEYMSGSDRSEYFSD